MSATRTLLRALPIAVLGVIDAFLVWTVPHVGDWYQFWYAGHLVVTGRSPYDASAWGEALKQPIVLGSTINIVRLNCEGAEPAACLWRYPPWTALAYAPFGALPLDVGVTALSLVTIASAAVAVVLLFRTYRPAPALATLATAIVLAAQPLLLATRTGHLDGLLLIGLAFVLSGLSGRTAALVVGATILSLKPHLFIVVGVVGVAVLVRRRRWADIALTGGALTLIAVATSVLYPPPLTTLGQDTGARIGFDVPTLWAEETARGAGWATVAVIALVVAVAAWTAWRSSERTDRALIAISAAVSLALAPYEQSYDAALLLPVVLLAVAAAGSIAPYLVRAVGLAAVVAISVAYPWWAYVEDILVRDQGASALVPVLTLVMLAVVLRLAGSAVKRATSR